MPGLPVLAAAPGSSPVVPAIQIQGLIGSLPFPRGHKKAQNRHRFESEPPPFLISPMFFAGTRARQLPLADYASPS